MGLARIQFSILLENSSSISNVINTEYQMSKEQYESLKYCQLFDPASFSRWVENNLFGVVVQQLNPRAPWKATNCDIQFFN